MPRVPTPTPSHKTSNWPRPKRHCWADCAARAADGVKVEANLPVMVMVTAASVVEEEEGQAMDTGES